MNKPTPPRHTSVARFHSEICRSCHVFDGPGDSMGDAHLNMKEGGGFLENLESSATKTCRTILVDVNCTNE